MHVCTIVARNYVPAARVLARSFRDHHPDGTCWTLVIDDRERELDGRGEPFALVRPDDLGIAAWDRMTAGYSVLELSTAVKPWLLRHLLRDHGVERITYLDPDIQVFDSLEEVDALLRDHQLVLNPHLTAPLPRDGRKPAETDILIAGTFNLGFVGVSVGDDTDRLLTWWMERLATDCIVDPERGYFVDQRWMDFAPGLVTSYEIIRDPGYNVAYWNLSSREVTREGEGYRVNGEPLRFFHFSGYDPDRPHELSLHQDRIRLESHPLLGELCDAYAEALRAEGYAAARTWPYGYGALPDGTRLDAIGRRLYREAVESGALEDESVFAPDGARRLLTYLKAPAADGGAAGVSRYLAALRESRPDLRASFPVLDAEGARRYLAWAQIHGAGTGDIPPALLPLPEGDRDGEAALRPGVNVVGYLGATLGVGEHARQLAAALETQSIPVTRVALRSHHEPGGAGPTASRAEAPYAVNLLCVNPDVVVDTAAQLGGDFFAGHHTVGYWAWEVASFPRRMLSAFHHVDEVWVGSRHVAEAVTPHAPVPVVRIPQPVSLAAPPRPVERAALGLPEGFLFLFAFDHASVFARKNPLAVVDAFVRAFAPGDGPSLVIKSLRGDADPVHRDQLREAAARHPEVHLIEGEMPAGQRTALIAACDAYVSLHRAEGFGYTLAEAMWLGRPVIATAYSGNLDYMTADNGWLVACEMVRIGPDAAPYPPDGMWAEPDLDAAAAAMRDAAADPPGTQARGARAAADIRRTHGPEAAGRAMAERLRTIMATPSRRAARAGPSPFSSMSTDWLEQRIRTGPVGSARPRFGKAQRAVRQALVRALRPVTVHQQMVDEGLLQTVQALEGSMQALAASQVTEARRADEMRTELASHDRFIARFGLEDALRPEEAFADTEWPEAPEAYWSPEYLHRRQEVLSRALDDPRLLLRFKRERELPKRYGVGFDERLVEFPWAMTRDLSGRLLDAGSTLNHPHVLARVRPRVDELHVVTLAPEPEAYPFLDISYLYADLRELPVQDGLYDCVVSLSTLEHVGMDNEQYGADGGRAPDADAELRRAVTELRRVLRAGGWLYLSVPFGVPEDFGFMRTFAAEDLERLLVEPFEPSEQRRELFLYTPEGWRRASVEDAAGARYRRPEDPAAEDRAAAARAVACLALRA